LSGPEGSSNKHNFLCAIGDCFDIGGYMSHIALYRKYRPVTFNEMVGQEHVTEILKNQIISGKISHAYIFSGTRGTGKTSAAKIFARAINCLNSHEGEPCNECEACKSILSGDSTDVVEMDAASNNSVENIRAIRQEVIYASTSVKYKVYIIDEAHMLSTSAFNALLKTLEEPPEGVVFILATTEEHKILPTILSRCIRFEFKKHIEENIISRLEDVLKDYDVNYTHDALKIIAKLSDGALRDALSILERCINNEGKNLTREVVQDIVGIVQKELIEELICSVLEYNVIETNAKVDAIIAKGKDLRYCLSQMIEMLMDLIIYASGDKDIELNNNVKVIADTLSVNRLNYVIKGLSKLDDNLRQTTNPNVIFRAKMLELASEIKIENKEDLLEKLKALELKIEKTNVVSTTLGKVVEKVGKPKESREEKVATNEPVSKDSIEEKHEEPKSMKSDFKLLDKIMKKASEADSPRLYSALSGIKAFESEDSIKFVTDNSFSYSLLKKEDLRQELQELVNTVAEKEYEITIDLQKEEEKLQISEFEAMLQNTGIPYTNID